MASRIVVIDSTPDAAEVAGYLARHGLAAETARDVDSVLRRLATDPPGLVLLQRRLRNDPGLAALRRLRAVSSVPAILRAMDADEELERVLALELGADDYLRHGTSLRELLARIRTVLRRARGPAAPVAEADGWRLCLRQRELFGPDGAPRCLTSAEFELMGCLARQQGQPVQRDALSLAVLRRPYQAEDRALDNLVLRLRRKLGDNGASARLIKSVRGVGYVFVGFDAGSTVRDRLARLAAENLAARPLALRAS
jgi:two-component system OmpR family response regulator